MSETEKTTTIIDNHQGNKDGQTKCPSCGSTDISQNHNTGKLRCNFCRHEFEVRNTTTINDDISSLTGEYIGTGSMEINRDFESGVTLKCESCGAEVLIDTNESTQARCHWCRNTLSINKQIENGAVPDAILPFSVKKDEAKVAIEQFVNSRKFFAHPKFTKEFTTENIMGVYFPYMTIDINANANLSGIGEVNRRSYRVKRGDDFETRYDIEKFKLTRKFDIQIDNLTIESSNEQLNNTSTERTNNVINAIMPFDVENSNNWDANYLRGFSSEKRDVNIDELRMIVNAQGNDIAKYQANQTATQYDRGICYDDFDVEIKGQRWNSVFLPVWLYSYYQNDNGTTHYVAVNGRSKKIMGSVPIHMPKLLIMSIIIEIFGVIMSFFATLFIEENDFALIFLLSGFIFFGYYYNKYRNASARYTYESDTKTDIQNMEKTDVSIGKQHGVRNRFMFGANQDFMTGSTTGTNIASDIGKQIISNVDIGSLIDKGMDDFL